MVAKEGRRMIKTKTNDDDWKGGRTVGNLGKFWTRDRCYDFKKFSPKKLARKLAFLTQNKAKLFKNLILTLVFEKNANFRRKLSKIDKNCDHNIDPWSQS
jgi:hypothetical protein